MSFDQFTFLVDSFLALLRAPLISSLAKTLHAATVGASTAERKTPICFLHRNFKITMDGHCRLEMFGSGRGKSRSDAIVMLAVQATR